MMKLVGLSVQKLRCPAECLAGCLAGCMAAWLATCSAAFLPPSLISSQSSCLFAHLLPGQLAGWLPACLSCRLAALLAWLCACTATWLPVARLPAYLAPFWPTGLPGCATGHLPGSLRRVPGGVAGWPPALPADCKPARSARGFGTPMAADECVDLPPGDEKLSRDPGRKRFHLCRQRLITTVLLVTRAPRR